MEEKKDYTAPEEKNIDNKLLNNDFQVTSEDENSNSNDDLVSLDDDANEVLANAELLVKDSAISDSDLKVEDDELSDSDLQLDDDVVLDTSLHEKELSLIDDHENMELDEMEDISLEKPEELDASMIQMSVDEHAYSLDENAHGLDEENEIEAIDISVYEAFSLSQLKDEAVRLLQEEDDIQRIRPAIIKLHELHGRLILEEREKIEHNEEDDDEIKNDALKQIDKSEAEFDAIWNLYKEKRKEYFGKLEGEREDNFNKKLSLLEALKNLIDSEEPLKKTFEEFKNIQQKWREIGMVPKEKNNELWLNYNHYVGLFLEKVNMYYELRDLDKKKNMEIKVELCEKAEALILDKSPHDSFKKLQDLHRQWKEIGPVPQEHSDELWERFKAASEKIRESRIGFYEEMKKKQEANLEAKTALLEKARMIASAELNSVKDWNDRTKEINDLFQLWRSIGRAGKDINDKVWLDFKAVLDAFFAARKEYFGEIRQEYDDNYNKKLNVCMQAEALKESSEWNKTSAELKHLQDEWKKIGPVPRAKSDVIWKRFRTACDYFFDRKNSYFKDLKKNESENLEKKLALIEELLKFEFSDERKANLDAIQDFQRRWVEIGRVPFDKKDEIQQKWRKIIDETLEKLKISRFENENKNFKERVEHLSESKGGQNELRDELRRLRGLIKKMEQDVALWENNLGFFSSSKNADILLKEYHDKIDKAKVDIKVMKEKEKFLAAQVN